MRIGTLEEKFKPFAERIQVAGLPAIMIDWFRYYYNQLAQGETGLIPEDAIQPIETLPDAESITGSYLQAGESVLRNTVLIKLNGGLGTSMGLDGPKSLLPVKNGLTFLDITARQAIQSQVPLVLMSSFSTRADSLVYLQRYPELTQNEIAIDFVQHKVPKVLQSNLSPAVWEENPELEWSPPGHGDIYTALVTSGMLDQLLDAQYEYAFVSNSDNLGAVIDRGLLGYFAENEFPFLMEVADRTELDKKGGHLACLEDGSLVLREVAQTPAEDLPSFQDIHQHRYFNTNNLWVNLKALKRILVERRNILGLPLIRNVKTLDPRDPDSPLVFQLETAMGTAISIFDGAEAIRVPRHRFAPVKRTDDLLLVRSDAYELTEDFRVIPCPTSTDGLPVIILDQAHYKMVDDLDRHFPDGPPSLKGCTRFEVVGNVKFGKGVVRKGAVTIRNTSHSQAVIEDGEVLDKDRIC